MSLTPATSVAFFDKSNPNQRGKKLARALKEMGWSVWGERFEVATPRGVQIQHYSFNFDFREQDKFNSLHFGIFENELSIYYPQNTVLKDIIDLLYFLVDFFGKEINFIMGCWAETLQGYTNEAGKVKKLDYFGSFAYSFHFDSILKAPPSFFYVNHSLLDKNELNEFKKKYRFLSEKKEGSFFFDPYFFECMQKGMVIGRSGFEAKR